MNHDDVDDYTVLCSRVAEQPDPVRGSKETHCDRCHVPVWVSPSTLRMTRGAVLTKVCRGCVTLGESLEMAATMRRGAMPAEQVDELVSDLLRRHLP